MSMNLFKDINFYNIEDFEKLNFSNLNFNLKYNFLLNLRIGQF